MRPSIAPWNSPQVAENTRTATTVRPSLPCAACCTRDSRPGLCRNRPQSSRVRSHHTRHAQSRAQRCRIRGTCERLGARKRAVCGGRPRRSSVNYRPPRYFPAGKDPVSLVRTVGPGIRRVFGRPERLACWQCFGLPSISQSADRGS